MTTDDPTIQVRIDLAEIKGMLTQTISNHESRLTNLESAKEIHDQRLNDKGKDIARHDERLKDLEKDVHETSNSLQRIEKEAKDDTKAKSAKGIAIGSLAIATTIGLIAVYNFINGLGM